MKATVGLNKTGALPLAEAAKKLGITPSALRMRWKRDTVKGFKNRGRLFIFVYPQGEHVHSNVNSDQTPKTIDDDGWTATAAQLISDRDFLRDQVTSMTIELREMRLQMAEERRRTDTLIQGFQNQVGDLTDRIKALPSPSTDDMRREIRAYLEDQMKPVLQTVLVALERVFKKR